MSRLVFAFFILFGAGLSFAADRPADQGKTTTKEERSTASKMRDTANRIGDDIGKNIGQAFRNANEGFKKRFNTNKPEEGRR